MGVWFCGGKYCCSAACTQRSDRVVDTYHILELILQLILVIVKREASIMKKYLSFIFKLDQLNPDKYSGELNDNFHENYIALSISDFFSPTILPTSSKHDQIGGNVGNVNEV